MTPNILLIYTGGTIGMVADTSTGALQNLFCSSGDKFAANPDIFRLSAINFLAIVHSDT